MPILLWPPRIRRSTASNAAPSLSTRIQSPGIPSILRSIITIGLSAFTKRSRLDPSGSVGIMITPSTRRWNIKSTASFSRCASERQSQIIVAYPWLRRISSASVMISAKNVLFISGIMIPIIFVRFVFSPLATSFTSKFSSFTASSILMRFFSLTFPPLK